MPADSHIGLAVVFDVPEGEDTAAHRANFYAKSRAGTKELLYYGFAGLGNKVMCRADMWAVFDDVIPESRSHLINLC